MMNKYFYLSVLLFCLSFSISAQEKTVIPESKIQKVIVFLKGAQVERTSSVSIPAGVSILRFQGLSPEIDEQSIQVKGTGDFTILSVNRQTNYVKGQKANEEINQLQSRAESLKEERELKENSNTILKKEEEMLAANQSIGSAGSGLDLEKLKRALDFQKARLTENKLKQLSNVRSIKELNLELQKVENQIGEIKGKSKSNTSNIEVKVSSKTASNGSFKITYLIDNAAWYPTYDLRSSDINKPVELIYRANISQRSGEDWKNARLVLSSGDPSRGGNKPTLRPFEIGYYIPSYTPASNITSVTGRIVDGGNGDPLPGVSIRVKGTPIATVSNVDGYYSIQIPSSNSVLEFSYVGYEKN